MVEILRQYLWEEGGRLERIYRTYDALPFLFGCNCGVKKPRNWLRIKMAKA